MTPINHLIQLAMQANARRRQQSYVNGILQGPDTTFRSELIEMMSSPR